MKKTIVLLLSAMVCAGGVGTTTAAAATPQPKVALFNLTATPLVQPDRFFFQANAGPYLKDLRWTGWGTGEAIGSGRYIRDCAVGPCGAPGENHQDHPVRFVVGDLGPCPLLGTGGQAYRSARVEIDRDGTIQTTELSLPYELSCAELPPRRVAKRAVASRVKRGTRVRSVKVTCRDAGDQTYTCVARFTQAGRARARTYTVGQTVGGRIQVHVGEA